MRPLKYSINVTLDGCIDHLAIVPGPDTHEHAQRVLAEADALLFGRVTYEMMESAWRGPLPPDWPRSFEPFRRTIDAAKKYVVSSALRSVDWNAELLQGDLATAVQRLKDQPGKGLYVGGVQLPMALASLGLIDCYEFVVHPAIAGRGPSLFAGLPHRLDLRLVDREQLPSGAMVLRYEPSRPLPEV